MAKQCFGPPVTRCMWRAFVCAGLLCMQYKCKLRVQNLACSSAAALDLPAHTLALTLWPLACLLTLWPLANSWRRAPWRPWRKLLSPWTGSLRPSQASDPRWAKQQVCHCHAHAPALLCTRCVCATAALHQGNLSIRSPFGRARHHYLQYKTPPLPVPCPKVPVLLVFCVQFGVIWDLLVCLLALSMWVPLNLCRKPPSLHHSLARALICTNMNPSWLPCTRACRPAPYPTVHHLLSTGRGPRGAAHPLQRQHWRQPGRGAALCCGWAAGARSERGPVQGVCFLHTR